MKYIYFLLIFIAMMLFGCAQSNTKTENVPETMTMSQLYDFNNVQTFTYKITSLGENSDFISMPKYSITSDVVNGESVWLKESLDTLSPDSPSIKIWVDKTTLTCLKFAIVIDGQTSIGSCPLENYASAIYSFAGNEKIVVAGKTYDVSKYSDDRSTYWVSSKVPVPLKAELDHGKVLIELASYD